MLYFFSFLSCSKGGKPSRLQISRAQHLSLPPTSTLASSLENLEMASLSSLYVTSHPSDSSPSDPILLQLENAQLLAQVANLQNQRAQLPRLASSAISVVQKHPSVDELEGMWILEEDREALQSVLDASEVGREMKSVWVWEKVSSSAPSFGSTSSPTLLLGGRDIVRL